MFRKSCHLVKESPLAVFQLGPWVCGVPCGLRISHPSGSIPSECEGSSDINLEQVNCTSLSGLLLDQLDMLLRGRTPSTSVYKLAVSAASHAA